MDTTYIQISQKKPAQVWRREVTSSVQSLKLADLKSAADEPPRKSRKQKLDKLAVKALDLRKSGADWYLQKQHIQ